jgi:hypothetical protein
MWVSSNSRLFIRCWVRHIMCGIAEYTELISSLHLFLGLVYTGGILLISYVLLILLYYCFCSRFHLLDLFYCLVD